MRIYMGSKGIALALVAIIVVGLLLTDVPRLHALTGEDFTITSDQTAPPTPNQPKSNDTVTITITNNSTGSIPDVGPITLTSNSTVTTNCSLTPASHSNILGGQNANSTLSCKPSVATGRFVINVTATDTAVGSGRVHSVFVPFVFDNLVNLTRTALAQSTRQLLRPPVRQRPSTLGLLSTLRRIQSIVFSAGSSRSTTTVARSHPRPILARFLHTRMVPGSL